MKIVLTTHQFFPHSAGGTEVVVHQAAKALQRRGHSVVIVAAQPCPDNMPYQDRFDAYDYDGLRIERFHHAYSPLQGQHISTEIEFNNRFFYHHFKQFLHEYSPDVVHCFHLHRLSASAVDAITELSIPAIFTATDFWGICPTSQLLLPDHTLCGGPSRNGANCIRHLTQGHPHGEEFQTRSDASIALTVMAKRLGLFRKHWYTPHLLAVAQRHGFVLSRLHSFAKVLCPSHTMRQMLIQNGLRHDRAVLQTYGLDTSGIARRDDKGLQPALRLGFLGQIAEHKGADILLNAFLQTDSANRAELHFHGTADASSEFIQKLKSTAHGQAHIHFHRPYAHRDVSTILAGIDVLVVPSIWYENTPLVIYEAFAAGVPAVVSNLGGLSEIVNHGQNGLVFEAGNSSELARHLQSLTDDRSLVTQLSANTLPPKSVNKYVDELEAFYDEIRR